MKTLSVVTWLCFITASAGVARSDDLTKATFTVTGLHCPPCTGTVESSLSQAPGIKSAKVDWKTKNAKIEFDETKTSAQKIAQLLAATRHMMGGGMQYAGRLALSVPELKDEASAKTVKDSLTKIPGVAAVTTFLVQHTVSVRFSDNGNTSSQQLIDALKQAGFEAKTY